MTTIRNYNPETDYPQIRALYEDSSTFGGTFDGARDSEERLSALVNHKPDAILVAEEDSKIVGTVTLFGDERAMWLYRFAIKDQDTEIAKLLWGRAREICKALGHKEVLVYAPTGVEQFETRYRELGFNKGGNYTAFWRDITD